MGGLKEVRAIPGCKPQKSTNSSLHAYFHPSPTSRCLRHCLAAVAICLEEGVAVCQSAVCVSACVCVCQSIYLCPHPAFSLPITGNHAISLATLPLVVGSTFISVSYTLPASRACSLQYLTNDIMPFCIPASALSPTHPSPTPSQQRTFLFLLFSSFLLIAVSLYPAVLPVVSNAMQGFIAHQ